MLLPPLCVVLGACTDDGGANDAGASAATEGATMDGGATTTEGATMTAGSGEDQGTGSASASGPDTTAGGADTTGTDDGSATSATDTGNDDTSETGAESDDTSGNDDGTSGGMQVGPVCDDDVVCTGDTVWSRRYGNAGSPSSNESLTAVATDAAGFSVIAGAVTGVADFGAAGLVDGPGAAFVAKIDPDGDVVWVRELDSAYSIEVNGLGLDDAGNATLVGSVRDDLIVEGQTIAGDSFGWEVLVVGYDTDGDLRFADLYGSSSDTDVGRDIAVAPDGRIAITGYFPEDINFGGNQLNATGASDAFVAVFDADLGHLWSRRFGDASTQQGYGVVFDGDGDVAVAALNYGTIDFGAGPHAATGQASIAVATLAAADGEEVWSRQFDPAPGATAPNPVLAADEDAVYVGTYASSAQNVAIDFGAGTAQGYFHVARLDENGDGTWSRGITSLRGVHGMTCDGGDGLLVVGDLAGSADFGDGEVASYMNTSDAFIAKYDAPTGELEWVRVVGDDNQQTQMQRAIDVGTDAEGHVYVGGSFNGIMDFGDGDLVSGAGFGGSDAFFVKVLP